MRTASPEEVATFSPGVADVRACLGRFRPFGHGTPCPATLKTLRICQEGRERGPIAHWRQRKWIQNAARVSIGSQPPERPCGCRRRSER